MPELRLNQEQRKEYGPLLSEGGLKQQIAEQIMEYLPSEARGSNLRIRTLQTRGGPKEAFLFGEGEPGQGIPPLYLEMLYGYYQWSGSVEGTMRFAADFYNTCHKQGTYGRKRREGMMFHAGIIMGLINSERNRALLADVPHRDYHDMSLVYQYMMPLPDLSFQTMTISWELAEQEGYTEALLYDAAMENTPNVLPLYMEDMGDSIYVVSNDRGINGAVAMLYGNALASIGETLDSNLYVIPSSVHEVIVLPVTEGCCSELRTMIYDVNRTLLTEEEILSDTLYYYSREEDVVRPV